MGDEQGLPRKLVGAVLQQCGACGHRHAQAGTELPAGHGSISALMRAPKCMHCGCEDFRLHADELAAMDAAARREAGTWSRPPLLPADVAQGMHTTLCGFETEVFHRAGWDKPAMAGVMVAFAGGDRPQGLAEDMAMVALLIKPLDIPARFYAEVGGGDPAQAMIIACEGFERSPRLFDSFLAAGGHDPAQSVVGWWALTELIVTAGGRETAQIRELVFADVDERIHSIVRRRDTGQAKSQYYPVKEYTTLVRPLIAAGTMDPGPGGELPVLTEAVLRLARLSAGAVQLRAVFGKDDQG